MSLCTTSKHFLNISRDSDSTAPLGSPFQHLTTYQTQTYKTMFYGYVLNRKKKKKKERKKEKKAKPRNKITSYQYWSA